MRKLLIAFVLLVVGKSYGQINKVSILIGKTDTEVIAYFDSLNSIRPNEAYKIKTIVAKDGDKMLIADYAIDDEIYLKCYSIITRFKRIMGKDICTLQLIMGTTEYGMTNINYVKDNFIEIKTAEWQGTIRDGYGDLKVRVKLTTEKDLYEIEYYLLD